MGGESLKGASLVRRRRRRLGLYHPLHFSPPPNCAAFARGPAPGAWALHPIFRWLSCLSPLFLNTTGM